MADRTLVQARTPFTVANAAGVPWQVRPGELYYADDPVVVGQPQMFREPDIRDSTLAGPPPRRAHRGFPAPEVAIAPPAGPARTPVTTKGKALAGAKTRPDGEV